MIPSESPDLRVTVELRDGKLVVSGAKERLTAEVVAGLRERKPELLAYLARFGGRAVIVGSDSSAALAQAIETRNLSSYLKEPDKPDNLAASPLPVGTYVCRVSVSDPTTPDNSLVNPDKRSHRDGVRRRPPFDPALARFFRAAAAQPKPEPEVEPAACAAEFRGDIKVELRRQNRSRWLMWVSEKGERRHRSDFATPFLDHAKRTAEHWYGPPLDGWHAIEGSRL